MFKIISLLLHISQGPVSLLHFTEENTGGGGWGSVLRASQWRLNLGSQTPASLVDRATDSYILALMFPESALRATDSACHVLYSMQTAYYLSCPVSTLLPPCGLAQTVPIQTASISWETNSSSLFPSLPCPSCPPLCLHFLSHLLSTCLFSLFLS